MDNDERLKQIGEEYGSGRMLTGEIKAELIKVCSAANPRVFVLIALGTYRLHALGHMGKPLRHHYLLPVFLLWAFALL